MPNDPKDIWLANDIGSGTNVKDVWLYPVGAHGAAEGGTSTFNMGSATVEEGEFLDVHTSITATSYAEFGQVLLTEDVLDVGDHTVISTQDWPLVEGDATVGAPALIRFPIFAATLTERNSLPGIAYVFDVHIERGSSLRIGPFEARARTLSGRQSFAGLGSVGAIALRVSLTSFKPSATGETIVDPD